MKLELNMWFKNSSTASDQNLIQIQAHNDSNLFLAMLTCATLHILTAALVWNTDDAHFAPYISS